MTELKNFPVKIIVIIVTVAVLFRISEITSYSAPYDVYNYDKWGEAVPSQAGYSPERSVSGYDLGAGAMDSPADIFYAHDDRFYIADTGNNRIIAVDGGFEKAVRIYDSFRMPDGTEIYLKNPSGIYVSAETGLMYIADTENSRILISDMSGNFISEITKPDDVLYDEKRTFMPQRVIADKAGNIYAVLGNITTGAVMFDSSGNFSGFYGANRVQPTAEIIRNYFSSVFMSDDKRSRRVRNIPAGITGIDIDGDFIFTCTASASQKTDIVKKLNSAGINIFADMDITIGDYAPVYDTSQNNIPATSITDIDIDEDGNINCLDSASGKIFQYDEDCNLLFIFGTNAEQTGGFRQASAIESHSGRIYVTDSQKDTITIFRETEFGGIVHEASALHNGGFYEEALEPWLEVLKRDGNYRRAYLGVASAKLRAGEYRESMKYAELADSNRIYNRAFEGWRLEFMKKNSGKLILSFFILVISLIIFRRIRKTRKSELKTFKWVKYAVVHPIEGFEDMRWKKAGSLKISFLIIFLLFLAETAHERLYGFQFYSSYDKIFSVVPYIVKSFVFFGAWVVGNWSVCTLFDGEGTMKNICIYSSYALVPYIVQMFMCTALSHILVQDEYIFLLIVQITGTLWTVLLMFSAVRSVHQYSPAKTITAILLTVFAMLIMLFLMILLLSLIQQVCIFILTIYTEISVRF